MIIKVKNLKFTYPAYEENQQMPIVLDGINIEIPQGQFVSVLGANGSGKSTFAKMLNAILLPVEGDVIVNEINTKDEDKLFDIRQNVGMVFQNPDNQIVATIVEDDVAFALENLGVPTDEMRTRVDEALLAVGMEKYAKHAPHRLSGGQKQRVAIAGVIAMRPKVIVLDEPTAMLDPEGRKEVLDTLFSLQKQYGATIILITHHMEEAKNTDRVIIMEKGKIILDDTPQNIFKQTALLKKTGLSDTLKKRNKEAPNTQNSPVILETKDLSYVYGMGTPFCKTAVDKVNISIKQGEFVGIIGQTGSGKSTLIQHFNALLKPTSGTVNFNGKDIWENKKEIRNIRFRCGLVFQYPEYQLFEDTVYKDIAFGPKNMGLPEDDIDALVRYLAAEFKITDLLEKSPFDISGGQKRKVAIAGIMAMAPQVLILDEPTAGLDPQSRADILDTIYDYYLRHKATVLMVSHSLEIIDAYASRVIKLNKGSVHRDY